MEAEEHIVTAPRQRKRKNTITTIIMKTLRTMAGWIIWPLLTALLMLVMMLSLEYGFHYRFDQFRNC